MIMASGAVVNNSGGNTLSTFGGKAAAMNMNVYKQNSGNNSNIKDSISFSKMNAKIKKR